LIKITCDRGLLRGVGCAVNGGLGRLQWLGKFFFLYKFSISDFKSIPSVFYLSLNHNSTQYATFIRSLACRASFYFV
jgi:hypothetical protein